MPSSAPAVTCDAISVEWPDGSLALDSLDADFDAVRTGIIGDNGTGKSTLLRVIAGDLAPTSGAVRRTGTIGYLPQDLALREGQTVSDLLGVTGVRRALQAIESGTASEHDFETVGNDWDIDERTAALQHSLGLDHIELDRSTAQVSGGELTLLALVGVLLSRPDILVLDEPTNNLDGPARERLYDAIERWSGVLIMVSHDREALRRMDAIAELRAGSMTMYGGGYDAYLEQVSAEQNAAERGVRDAKAQVNRQKQDLIETQIKLARRERAGRKASIEKREPKIVMGNRKRAAQVSAGKLKGEHQEDLAEAREALREAELRLRADDEIRIELPETALPIGRLVVELDDLLIKGPERIALTGRNGAGKTTLLNRIAENALVPYGFLRQRLDVLEDDASLIDNIARLAPSTTTADARNRLAQFLLRGDQVSQPIRTLSGGERLRAVLAAVLMREPAPQLLMLDEPTNNLDLASVRHLTEAMRAYRGALIVVSHDHDFLDDLGLTRELVVRRGEPLQDAPTAI